MGSRPAKSPMKSKVPTSRAASRSDTASRRMPSSMAATRRGVKLLPAMERIRVLRRVHREERHRTVRVGPEGGGIETDAVRVGVVVDISERGEDVRVAGVHEEVELGVVEDRRLGS